MKTLTKDARGFIEGVTAYIRQDRAGARVLPRVESLFTKVTATAKRERSARVLTAVPLTGAERDTVTKSLEKILGHAVECDFKVSEELLGGIKVQVADWVVDSSLATQLASIAESLM